MSRGGLWGRSLRGRRVPAGMRPPFSFVLAKENAPRPVEEKTVLTNRRTVRSSCLCMRGSRESVRRRSMAPSTLRRTCPVKNCTSAFDGAERGRGGNLNRRISAPARSAPLRAALAAAVGCPVGAVGADSISARCAGFRQTPRQRVTRGKRSKSDSITTPVTHRTVYAAPGPFDCRGKAQGRRGLR